METHRAGKVNSGLTTERLKWLADKVNFTDQVLNSDLSAQSNVIVLAAERGRIGKRKILDAGRAIQKLLHRQSKWI